MDDGYVKFASGGDDIKIWDLSSSAPLQQFSPHAGPISGLCWSQNNQLLASTSSVGDKIVLTYASNANTIKLAEGEKQTCLALNSTSRYLACGGKNQLVSIWDLKTRKLKRTYKEHRDSITCVVFNWNDTYMASGAANGDILLHNVVSGQPGSPMVAPKAQTIRGIEYSHFKKSLLAAASDDGGLTLWDTNTNKMVATFSDAHNAPTTSLSFSPVNNLLLASAGLDKKVVCYDVNGKSVIKTMTVDSPLTSLSFMQDGATLAAGSTRGKIYVFDLRMGSSPLRTVNAHKSSVQCIKFQNAAAPAKMNGPTSKSRTASSQKKPSTMPFSSALPEQSEPTVAIPDNVKSSKESLNEKNHVDTSPMYEQVDNMDIISPIREGGDPAVLRLQARNGPSSLSDDRPETMGKAEVTQQRHNSLPGAGIFSPLSSESDGQVVNNITRRNPIGSVNLDSSPYGPVRKVLTNHVDGLGLAIPAGTTRVKSPVNSGSIPSEPLSPRRTSFPATSSESRSIPTSLDIPSLGLGATDTSPTTTPTIYRPVFSPEELPTKTFPRGTSVKPTNSSLPEDTQKTVEEPAAAAGVTQNMPFQTFQVEFIKNLIEESLEEFRVAIHRDVTNLQLEMLRQFQIQQTEIQALLERYSVNEALLTEIESLREENKRLKAKY